jgi:hypothetical protein
MFPPSSPSEVTSPRFWVLLGGFVLFWATAEVLTGEAVQRYREMVNRRVEPKTFWQLVAVHYSIGLGLVGYSIYRYINP